MLAVLAAVTPGCANEHRASAASSATVILRCPDPAGAYAPHDLVPIAADVRGLSASSVEFLVNGTVIARDDKPPFETTWLARDLGTMHVEARARSSSGETARSAGMDITVAPLGLVFQELNGDDIGADLKTGKEPAVLLTSPAHGTVFCHPAPIALIAAITPTASPIARVEFEVDGRPIATLSKPPFVFTWPQPSLGRHAVAVRATDTHGRVAVTPRVLILVTGRAAPHA